MPADLRLVKNFPQLLKYLRDELLWPIETTDVEELTFEYAPADFAALAPDHHVQIEKILQLRPLVTGQPWGVFYVQFKKARLPVVVLRELLASLVFKKRQSANKTERPAWECHDLLFISSYGEDADHRHLNFAHFSDQPNGHHLPALRVLDWDDGDTDRALSRLDSTLQTKLHWPQDDTNLEKWREQWSAAFVRGLRDPIKKAEQLAHALAVLAQRIRGSVLAQMAVESERGKLRTLHAAFKAALIQDLEPEQFADMFAQTIAYGLFTNATRRTVAGGGTAITADGAAESVTSLSPFLRDLLDEFLSVGGRRRGGLDYDKLGVNEVVDLLNADTTDLAAVLDDFGHKTRDEDPVIHFYEGFAKLYDPIDKVKRGEFYTPTPVVSYIVRSVHELLQTEFALPHGLASTETWSEMLKKLSGLSLPNLSDDPDPALARLLPTTEFFVQVLDPATGTGTFLVETIDVIHRHLRAAWDAKGGGLGAMPEIHAKPAGKPAPKTFADFWNLYVPTSLLPRLYAFELKMAPYAIAHMKIALKLADTGFTLWKELGPDNRVNIYLTNALDPKVTQTVKIGFEALAHEAEAVNQIKWNKRFTVVIGNPPYSVISSNFNPFIDSLMDDYKKHVRGEQGLVALADDYLKFVRLSQKLLAASSCGVWGMITNHGYLKGVIHRGVRKELLNQFNKLYLLDLHGDSNIGEQVPLDKDNDNVFDIQQGVAVSIGVGQAGKHTARVVRHSHLWGTRQEKYTDVTAYPISRRTWTDLHPSEPRHFLVPFNDVNLAEYENYPSINELMPINSCGVKTHRDGVVIDYEKKLLVSRMSDIATEPNLALLRERYGIKDTPHWKLKDAKSKIKPDEVKHFIQHLTYRPFDYRWIYYNRAIIEKGDSKYPTLRHMLRPNRALLTARIQATGIFDAVFISKFLVEMKTAESSRSCTVFPLYLTNDSDAEQAELSSNVLRPNLSPKILHEWARKLGVKLNGDFGLPNGLTPEAILDYAYAIFHSPNYRSRYAEFLKIDFPRLPLTGSSKLFHSLAPLGEQLVALHLLESPLLAKPRTKFIGSAKTVIEKVSYADGTVFIDKAQTTGFAGVPEAVFEFHIGGYQVCEKWLKDRKDRTLSAGDVAHYQQIVIALQETIRLMAEIDVVIDGHGGFPAAFADAPAPEADAPKRAPKPAADLGLQIEDELPLA